MAGGSSPGKTRPGFNNQKNKAMKTKKQTIGKLIAGYVLAFCLTSNVHAQLPPGVTNAGISYGDFNPTPVFTYSTNISLKWYLSMDYESPFGIMHKA
jgi:hypothetical protein